MAKVRGAKTIPELDEALDFENIVVDDGTPIGKRMTKASLKALLTIEGTEMEPLVGGTTSGTALVVPDGPAGEQRTAEVSSGKWYDFGSGPVEASADRRWKSYWSGTAWSLKDMGALPNGIDGKTTEKFDISKSYIKGSQVFFNNSIWESLASTSAGESPISAPTKWTQPLLKGMVYVSRPTSNNIQPPNIFRNGYIKTDGSGVFVSGSDSSYFTTGLVPVGFLEVGKQVYFKNIYKGFSKYYSYYDINGNLLQIPGFSGKSLVIGEVDKVASINARPTSDVYFFESTIKTVPSEDTTSKTNFMILLEDKVNPSFIPFKDGVTEIDGKKIAIPDVPLVPENPTSPTSKNYVDNIVKYSQEIRNPLVYKDEDGLFENYNGAYAGPSVTGWIRSGVVGRINSAKLVARPISTTASSVRFRIGFVDNLSSFDESLITELTYVDVNKSDLVEDVDGKITIKFNEVIIPTGKHLVILPDQVLRVQAYTTETPPDANNKFFILYKTDGTTKWQYGYRYSSGIEVYYENKDLINIIENHSVSNTDGLFSLKGQLIAFLGDSITAPYSGSYTLHVASLLEARLLNLAVSGARYNDTYIDGVNNTTIDFSGNQGTDPNNTISNQVRRLIRHVTPLGQQISWTHPISRGTESIPVELGVGLGNTEDIPKVIVIAASTNDTVFGDVSEWNGVVSQSYTSLDRKNLYSSIRWAVETLKIVFPTAQIFLSTPIEGFSRPYNSGGQTRADRIITVGKYFNCQIIDALNESGISEKFERHQNLGEGRFLHDGLHPNNRGWKLMGNYFAQQIKTKYFPIPE